MFGRKAVRGLLLQSGLDVSFPPSFCLCSLPSPPIPHQDTLRSCTQKDGCDSAEKIPEIRARVAELVRAGLTQSSASSAATGYSVSSGVPADGIVGDETLDPLFLWTGEGGTETRGELGVARERYGDFDTEQRAGVVAEGSCPLAAASPGKVEEGGAGRVYGEAGGRGINGGEDTPGCPEHGAAWCRTDAWGVDVGTESRTFEENQEEEEEESGNLGVRGGGVEKDRFSAGQKLSSESGGTSDAEASAVVFALSGWTVDEIEALLQVRRQTRCSGILSYFLDGIRRAPYTSRFVPEALPSLECLSTMDSVKAQLKAQKPAHLRSLRRKLCVNGEDE